MDIEYICNKSGYWDFCKYCHHSKPHKEITIENKPNYIKNHKEMHEVIECFKTGALCSDGTNKEIHVKCIEYLEEETKIQQIKNILKITRKQAISIYKNIDKLNKIMEYRNEKI